MTDCHTRLHYLSENEFIMRVPKTPPQAEAHSRACLPGSLVSPWQRLLQEASTSDMQVIKGYAIFRHQPPRSGNYGKLTTFEIDAVNKKGQSVDAI